MHTKLIALEICRAVLFGLLSICAAVLPHHLLSIGSHADIRNPHIAHLIPWFSQAFLMDRGLVAWVSLGLLASLGGAAGFMGIGAAIRYGLVMFAFPFLLFMLEFWHDIHGDPTSHNLWPFELVLVMLALMLPILLGSACGLLLRLSLVQSRLKGFGKIAE